MQTVLVLQVFFTLLTFCGPLLIKTKFFRIRRNLLVFLIFNMYMTILISSAFSGILAEHTEFIVGFWILVVWTILYYISFFLRKFEVSNGKFQIALLQVSYSEVTQVIFEDNSDSEASIYYLTIKFKDGIIKRRNFSYNNPGDLEFLKTKLNERMELGGMIPKPLKRYDIYWGLLLQIPAYIAIMIFW